MKSTRIISFALMFVVMGAVSAPAYFTSDDVIVTRNLDGTSAATGNIISVTSTLTNSEADALRGIYYSEHLPEGLQVATQSVEIDGLAVSNYTFETGSLNDVYAGTVTHRWILETPGTFTQDNPVPSSLTVEIVFSVTAAQAGTYRLEDHSWTGYFPGSILGTFAYAQPSDTEVIEFFQHVNTPPEADPKFIVTDEDTPAAVTLTGSDVDPDILTFEIESGPANGTLTGTSPQPNLYTGIKLLRYRQLHLPGL